MNVPRKEAVALAIAILCSFLYAARGEEEGVESLVRRLAGTTPGDLEYGALALKIKAKGQTAIPVLAKAATAGQGRSRGACARCLGEIGGEQAIAVLLQLLDEGQELEDVFIGLATAGDKKVIKPMRAWLSPEKKLEENTRKRLIICLGELGDEGVIPDLIELLRPSASPGHRYGANEALQVIAGVDFGENRQAAADWYKKKAGIAIPEARFDPIHLTAKGKQEDGIPGSANILSADVDIDADFLRLTFHLRERADEDTVVYRVWMRFTDGAKARRLVTASRSPLPEENVRPDPLGLIRVDEIMPGGGGELIRLVVRGCANDQQKRTFAFSLPRGSGIEKIDAKSTFTFETFRGEKVVDKLELTPKGE